MKDGIYLYLLLVVGIFSQVVFASYGTPSGSNGQYTQGSCHAASSILKVSQQFVGKSTAVIGASNSLFGDPCGGTYKRLYIVLKYTGGSPTTTTTTTTTTTLPPTCGPYDNISVTGKLNGAVWGSGPYTDDSDFGVAAVHAGLAEVGETVTLVPSNIAYHLSYPGSTSNGVTTNDWLSGWCGYDIGLLPTPTTTTIEPETTTTTEPETTTTTTEPEVAPVPITSTTAPEVETTTTIPEEPETTFVTTPESDTTTVSTPEVDTNPITEQEPEDNTNQTIPEVTVPEVTQDSANQTVEDIFNNTDNPEELGNAVSDAVADADSPAEVAALVTSLLDQPLSTEEFAAVVDAVFADDLSTAELSAALDAVFSEPLSDEKFNEVIDAVLDTPLTDEQFAEVVDILESDTVTEEQVASAVDQILENGVTEDQATELATSEKVLESIDGDQAADIFEEIPVGELSTEEEAALVDAVTNAPEEVKNAFEETIDVYSEGLDDYVPVGSNIDVGTRRSLLAATTVLSTVTVAGASGASGSGPSPKPSPSGGGSGGPDPNSAARKEEKEQEEDEEESPEIEGPEGDEEENNFTRNSIFKYQEGTMKRTFSPLGFIKKFAKETAALAFTISGTVIVFATLSGDTRKITLIATSVAFAVHYLNAMLKNDE